MPCKLIVAVSTAWGPHGAAALAAIRPDVRMRSSAAGIQQLRQLGCWWYQSVNCHHSLPHSVALTTHQQLQQSASAWRASQSIGGQSEQCSVAISVQLYKLVPSPVARPLLLLLVCALHHYMIFSWEYGKRKRDWLERFNYYFNYHVSSGSRQWDSSVVLGLRRPLTVGHCLTVSSRTWYCWKRTSRCLHSDVSVVLYFGLH